MTFSVLHRLPTVAVILFSIVVGMCVGASAQIAIVNMSQAALLQKSRTEQGAVLAATIRDVSNGTKCAGSQARLEKAYKEGTGGWLVRCVEGKDYWVVFPTAAGKGATVLACIHARLAGTNCYQNFRTVLPEHAEQCTKSPHLDIRIGACTAFIQSGHLANNPKKLAFVYQQRAVAFASYNAFDFAVQDFERAAALVPSDPNTRFNLGVTFERRALAFNRKSDFDQAIASFSQAIRLNPNFAKAFRKRGAAYKAKGEGAKADADLSRAQALDAAASPQKRR